jgi:hypothetical protein
MTEIPQRSPQLRNKSCDLAGADWIRAAVIANQIDDPWYACQAFAWCGRFAPQSESLTLIDKAFQRADAGKDAYHRVAVAAWPLRALLELGHAEQARREFEKIESLASQVEPPSGRGEACFLIFSALAVGPPDFALRALGLLLKLNLPADHWRQERAVREAIIIAMTLKLIDAEFISTHVQDERLEKQINNRLAREEIRQPRPFFWPRVPKADI